ncbi:hypothetical protein PUR50_20615, partial [Enterobacter hormaechei subsp. steigerwaltii]|nr:hypothetical protein [Enterobacter hormaechei subsp. steigerwaltii]
RVIVWMVWRCACVHTHISVSSYPSASAGDCAQGDLDDLPLINKEEQPDKGFLASISRGIMPSLPFL